MDVAMSIVIAWQDENVSKIVYLSNIGNKDECVFTS